MLVPPIDYLSKPRADVFSFRFMWLASLWFSFMACGVGLLVFWETPRASMAFFPLTYITLLLAILTTVRCWHEMVVPLSLILLIGCIRFTIPAVLLWFSDPDVPIFQMMGLQQADWLLGHAL